MSDYLNVDEVPDALTAWRQDERVQDVRRQLGLVWGMTWRPFDAVEFTQMVNVLGSAMASLAEIHRSRTDDAPVGAEGSNG